MCVGTFPCSRDFGLFLARNTRINPDQVLYAHADKKFCQKKEIKEETSNKVIFGAFRKK